MTRKEASLFMIGLALGFGAGFFLYAVFYSWEIVG